MAQLIYNAIQTPDGTIIQSRNVHEYVSHKDKNGKYYAVDGGLQYTKRVADTLDFKELSLYDNSKHEVIREFFNWGSRGINGNEPIKYILLKDIDDDHLNNIIKYLNSTNQPTIIKIFMNEIEYRLR